MESVPFELDTLNHLIACHPQLRAKTLADVEYNGKLYPIIRAELGCTDVDAPTVMFVGGVHGVERIGCQVQLALLESLMTRLEWDVQLQHLLTRVRLSFVPIVNPVGLIRGTRCNGQGVDLMRNAPITSADKVTFLVGGHKLSPKLPWYRGKSGMERETSALVNYVNSLLATSSSVIALDAHSGFGISDHVWFPYASRQSPMDQIGRIYRLKQAFESSFPHHNHYRFSPQSLIYQTHGDIWDYLVAQNHSVPFVPLTLEMGSWSWVKKNPRQLFNFAGLFNPQKTHRYHRTLRKHTVFMQFLMDMAASRTLEKLSDKQLHKLDSLAYQLWYE
ncbi:MULTISPECIES: M14 family zinc carboxypeptidase [unclassified Shewanella]|uniref:M14 family zinc carboxypeptidase n=1 Tax=unclassified Shewanella TaxID=196818 RepID=UPI001BBAA30D|nr:MULTISPECIES: M14 family zinc carboxypeptidase [unclassified Shewanella]GIU07582.1 peptidase M14 [Shewanella sp. MBTL60-112-B1]GIU30174.1 peptidase M14 [Shewanella sp. MBTL60-112-B2]